MRSGCVTAKLSVSSRPWQSQCVAMSEKNGRSHRRVLGCVVGMTCGHPQTIRLRRRQRSSLSLSKHILTHGCAPHCYLLSPKIYAGTCRSQAGVGNSERCHGPVSGTVDIRTETSTYNVDGLPMRRHLARGRNSGGCVPFYPPRD
jgi:hypothetical protein